jgi:ribosome-binding ATPase YchF (GTP1/OBG family)
VYDIAGLIKGAAQGTGLGNQFLNAVQGVDLIVHLVRCFEATDGNVPIAHVEGEGKCAYQSESCAVIDTCHTVDPQRDIAIIHHELIAKDLEHVTRLQSNTLRIKTTMDHKWLRRVLDECASGSQI